MFIERVGKYVDYDKFVVAGSVFFSCRIAEMNSPRERMIQVFRWYLASYHAGRKSSVAKKPYNPVLGETFYCYWNLPHNNDTVINDDKVKDGPVPWATREHLTFVAEQVSHHPPSK